MPPLERPLVYVGTYTSGANEGIYIYSLDPATGALSPVNVVSGDINPSFLAIHPNGRWLYAVNEIPASAEQKGGAVTAYAIESGGTSLTRLSRQPTLSTGPCHVSVDASGRFAFVSNYSGGGLTVLPIQADGSLASPSDYIQHHGTTEDVECSETPHVHSALSDPTGRLVFVADLGLDKVMVYSLDGDRGKLQPYAEPWIACRPSSGPRHFTFHPNGKRLYVINELDSTIGVYSYEVEHGCCKELQVVPALPSDSAWQSWCADIHLHPNGKFLYGSNRGHDSLVIYSVDDVTGLLTYVTHVSTGGHWPRNFAFDPSGSILLAANERSDSIVSFWVNQDTGMLTPTGQVTVTPKPACVLIVS